MNFRPADPIEIDFGISTGFKAPSLYSLYDPQYGNPNLKPEESVQLEVGTSVQASPSLDLSLRGFGNLTRNRFGYEGAPNFRGINIERAEVVGVEFSADATLEKFVISPSLTYLESEDLATGRELTDIPRWKSTLKTTYHFNPDHSLMASLISKSDRESNVAGQKVAGFFRVDLSSRHALTPQITVTTRLENLLDRDYQEIRGYRVPGLSAYAGIEIRSD
jgi:vitamin B12 transporter